MCIVPLLYSSFPCNTLFCTYLTIFQLYHIILKVSILRKNLWACTLLLPIYSPFASQLHLSSLHFSPLEQSNKIYSSYVFSSKRPLLLGHCTLRPNILCCGVCVCVCVCVMQHDMQREMPCSCCCVLILECFSFQLRIPHQLNCFVLKIFNKELRLHNQ